MGVTDHDNQREPVDSKPGLEDAGVLQNGSVTTKRRSWYRSVPFQIAVASGVSFTAPGMWDALGGLGAGGAAKPVSTIFTFEITTKIAIVRRISSQRSRLRSLLHRLCSSRWYQQPHRPPIRSRPRRNWLPTIRRRTIHQQRASHDLVHASRQRAVWNLSWVLLGC